MHSIDFHAHHSPLGAYATFTCGRFGAGGGFTIEGAKPASQNLIIGYLEDGLLHALPFFTGAAAGTGDYVEGAQAKTGIKRALQDVRRAFGGGDDRWEAGDLAFAIHTPVVALPDPDVVGEAALARAVLPVVTATLTLDNRRSAKARRLVFAVGAGQACRFLAVGGAKAVGWGREIAIAAPEQPGLEAFVNFNEGDWVVNGDSHLLGATCGLALEVPAGAQAELRLVFGFCRQGVTTTGLETTYWYTRHYPTLESVLAAGLARFAELRALAAEQDRARAASGLDAHQRFLVAHAERSYWGNTQLLCASGRPLWVVLEGEYAMINTFDLTVDMMFYELRRNPWTVRNVLDQFVERYSYVDRLNRPPADAQRAEQGHCRDPHQLSRLVPAPAERDLPGGISFCHDMGVQGNFTPPGWSSYECPGLIGCFSYMTCEQLYNWILTATSYVLASGDAEWLARRAPVLQACLESALNRDDPVPALRDGVCGLDSTRCAGGWEITTYDSLDPSLGQTRNNLYMAVKGWAAMVGLARCFQKLGDDARRREAEAEALRAVKTVAARFDAELGFIPAVFEAGNRSAIIPAIEGLVYPLVWGERAALDPAGPHGPLLAVLRRHLEGVLKDGVCLFADGGWKLSSTSDNSWISKIFICQHIAERVYGLKPDARSHSAHARWQQIGSADWAMSDQCISGVGKGSKYYPRCVTADLWLGHPAVR